MSKQLRVEVRLTVLVHVGTDITENAAPDRLPDAGQTDVRMTRVAHCGPLTPAADSADGYLALMLANASPVIGERLRHALREKNL